MAVEKNVIRDSESDGVVDGITRNRRLYYAGIYPSIPLADKVML